MDERESESDVRLSKCDPLFIGVFQGGGQGLRPRSGYSVLENTYKKGSNLDKRTSDL
jgi:hypothetical protein